MGGGGGQITLLSVCLTLMRRVSLACMPSFVDLEVNLRYLNTDTWSLTRTQSVRVKVSYVKKIISVLFHTVTEQVYWFSQEGELNMDTF